MRNLARKILSGTLWIGRGTAAVTGLAVLLALTVGLASTALAGTGIGSRFDLGQTNAVNAISSLVGGVAGPSLKITNDSTASGATALELRVESGSPPLKVDSGTRVVNLNADRLDGKSSTSFFSGDTYQVREERQGGGGGATTQQNLICDPGDVVLGGGGRGQTGEDYLAASTPFSTGSGWNATIEDNGTPTRLTFDALCADFPPLRPDANGAGHRVPLPDQKGKIR